MRVTYLFYNKIWRFLRQLWRNSALYRLTLTRGPTPKYLSVIPTDPWPGDIYVGRLLLDGKFVISNQVVPLADLWLPNEMDPSVLVNLHDFTWLRDLRALGDNAARRLARQLIVNWVNQNQDWNLCSWDVGVTGHRIANWIALYDFFCSSADENFRALFFREIARQARHLSYAWEDTSMPLDRIYALKGIIYAAIVFPGESYRLALLLPKLEKELQEQLLPDGGYMNRCLKTHVTVLRDLIDIRAMLRLIRYDVPYFLQTTISQMAPIVRLLRHGDGRLAVFGGGTQVSTSIIDMALSLADVRGRPPQRASHLGFERCVHKSSLVLLNVGSRVSGVPSSIDQEDSTGTLNFEWSIGRDRLILQGDIILQTQEGEHCRIGDSMKPESVQAYRSCEKGHMFLDTFYECWSGIPFSHRRQLYLEGDEPNLRGEDIVQLPYDAMCAIRFVLDKRVDISLASNKRGAVIRMLHDGKVSQQWRLLASGIEEIAYEPCAGSRTILLLGHIKMNQPTSVKWAFCPG